jgi:hypothetical protein
LRAWRKRSLTKQVGFSARFASSLLSGFYIAYTFAPGGISAGFAAIPTPASFALIGTLMGRRIVWSDVRPNLVPLVLSFVIVTIVHFPLACASRRARERDRQFDERQRKRS